MTTPFEQTMIEITKLEARYDYQVLGTSGRLYSGVPKEVWDRVAAADKRAVDRMG